MAPVWKPTSQLELSGDAGGDFSLFECVILLSLRPLQCRTQAWFQMMTWMLLLIPLPLSIKLSQLCFLQEKRKVSLFIYVRLLTLAIFQQAVIDPDKTRIFKTSFLCLLPFLLYRTQEKTKSQKANLKMPYGMCQLQQGHIILISVLKILGSPNPKLCYLINNVSKFFSLERTVSSLLPQGMALLSLLWTLSSALGKGARKKVFHFLSLDSINYSYPHPWY